MSHYMRYSHELLVQAQARGTLNLCCSYVCNHDEWHADCALHALLLHCTTDTAALVELIEAKTARATALQTSMESQVGRIRAAMPRGALLIVTAQTDLQLAREMLKQRAACSDTRTASTWTKEQQDSLHKKIAASKLGLDVAASCDDVGVDVEMMTTAASDCTVQPMCYWQQQLLTAAMNKHAAY
eukprot:2482-Heterococcus_DN1.PRE.2